MSNFGGHMFESTVIGKCSLCSGNVCVTHAGLRCSSCGAVPDLPTIPMRAAPVYPVPLQPIYITPMWPQPQYQWGDFTITCGNQ